FEVREIDGRNAVLPREKIGDIFICQEAKLHQSRAQAAIGFFLNLRCLLQLLRANDLLFDEKITQPLRHAWISYACRKTLRFLLLLSGAKSCASGGEIAAYRVDRNCQRIRALAPVTLVPVRGR